MSDFKWSENQIARALALQFFHRKCLVVVPNCNWTGNECDLLCVNPDLRIIDIEIKISRSDLRADAKKYKWWKEHFASTNPKWHEMQGPMPEPREWPPRVWKHYYALPAEIWSDDLAESLPSDSSGIILLSETKRAGEIKIACHRRAKPNKAAQKLPPEAAVSIARLASLRMWDAYQAVAGLSTENARLRAGATSERGVGRIACRNRPA